MSDPRDTAPSQITPRRRRRRTRVWLAISALAIIAVIVWQIIGAINGGSSGPQYTTTTADKGTLAVTVDGSGYVHATKTASVFPRVGGTVSGLRVGVGRNVSEGDVLFIIDNDGLDTAATRALASHRSSKQQVEQASLTLLQAKQQLDELENPSDSSTRAPDPTEQDLEIARERVDAAEHGLSAAKASREADYDAYQKALEEQESRTVTAPMDGVITELNIASGDTVSSGGSSGGQASSASGGGTASGASSTGTGNSSSVAGSSSAPVVISDMQSLYAKVSVNEVDVTSVKRRQKVTMTFDAVPGLTITGKVFRVSPGGTSTSGVVTFDMTISFDIQSQKLKPGMTTSASIVTAIARDTVLVPNASVQTSESVSYVRVLDSTSATATPRQVLVKTGLANDTMTQVVSGLEGGEIVVTGQRVEQDSNSSSGGSTFRMPGMGGPPGEGTRSSGGTSGGTRTHSGSSSGDSAPAGGAR